MAHRSKWEWPTREALEVKASPLVCAFWQETGVDLTVASIKLCWESPPRALYHQRENGPTTHVITFLDELVVQVPSLDAWDQFFVATCGGCTMGPYRSIVVQLLPQPGSRPQPHDAGSTIPGHG